MKIFLSIFIVLTLFIGGSSILVAGGVFGGFIGAGKNAAVNALVNEAKKTNPELAGILDRLLAGVSIATDPVAVLEGVYPGSIFASGISQLLDKHGSDILRKYYRDSQMDEQGFPRDDPVSKIDGEIELCDKLVNKEIHYCAGLLKELKKLQENKEEPPLPEELIERQSREILEQFYEHLEDHGKNKIIKKAGSLAISEFDKEIEIFDTKKANSESTSDATSGTASEGTTGTTTGTTSGDVTGTSSEGATGTTTVTTSEAITESITGTTSEGRRENTNEGTKKDDAANNDCNNDMGEILSLEKEYQELFSAGEFERLLQLHQEREALQQKSGNCQ